MSKVNMIRLVNLNYGNNSEGGKIRVTDVPLDCHQQNTFISLENAGGKSVMIQNIQSLLVSHEKRDLKQRKFDEFHREFGNSLPTIIMMELALDNHNGYVLLGKVVMRHKVASEPLTVYNFISEYKDCDSKYSIRHLPIYDHDEDGQPIYKKKIDELHQSMDEWSKDKKAKFNIYNFSITSQRKAYYQELKRFGLDSKVFDHTSHKINCSESGITNLYKQYVNQDKFVCQEIFPVIYDKYKLNNAKYRDKIKDLLEKRLKNDEQHKQVKFIDDIIQGEMNQKLLPLTKEYFATYQEQLDFLDRIEATKGLLVNQYEAKQLAIEQQAATIQQYQVEWNTTSYRQASASYYHQADQLAQVEAALAENSQQQKQLEDEKNNAQAHVDLQACLYLKQDVDEIKSKIKALEAEIKAQKEQKNTQEELEQTGGQLYQAYQQLISNKEQKQAQLTTKKTNLKTKKQNLEQAISTLNKDINQTNGQMIRLEESTKHFTQKENHYNQQFKAQLSFEKDLFHHYLVENLFDKHQADLTAQLTSATKRLDEISLECQGLEQDKLNLKNRLEANQKEQKELANQLRMRQDQVANLTNQLEIRQAMIRNYKLSWEFLNNQPALEAQLSEQIDELRQGITKMNRNKEELQKKLTLLDSGNVEQISDDLAKSFEKIGVEYEYGINLLKHQGASANAFIEKYPILPFALVVDEKHFERIKEHQDELVFTDKPVYIVQRESLRHQASEQEQNPEAGELFVYARFNKDLLDEESLASKKAGLQAKINELTQQMAHHQAFIDERTKKLAVLEQQDATEELLAAAERELAKDEEHQQELISAESQIKLQIEQIEQKSRDLLQEEHQVTDRQKELKTQQLAFNQLAADYQSYLADQAQIAELKSDNSVKKATILTKKEAVVKVEDEIEELNHEENTIAKELGELTNAQKAYLTYQALAQTKDLSPIMKTDVEIINKIKQLTRYYESLKQELGSLEALINDKQEQTSKLKTASDHLEQEIATHKIANLIPNYQQIMNEQSYSSEKKEKARQKRDQLKGALKELINEATKLNQEKGTCEAKLEKVKQEITDLNQKAACPKEELIQLNYAEQISYYQKEAGRLTKAIQAVEQSIKQIEHTSAQIKQALDQLGGRFGKLDQQPTDLDPALEQSIKAKIDSQQLKEYTCQQFEQAQTLVDQLNSQKRQIKQQIKQMAYGEKMTENSGVYRKILEFTQDYLENNDAQIIRMQEQYIQKNLDHYEFVKTRVAAFDSDLHELAQLIALDLETLTDEINKIDQGTAITINKKREKLFKIKVKSELIGDNEALKRRCQNYLTQIVNKYYQTSDSEEQQLFKDISFENIFDKIIGLETITITFKIVNDKGSVSKLSWDKVQCRGVPSGAQRSCVYLAILLSLINYISKDSVRNLESTQGKFLIMDNPFGQTQTKGFIKVLLDIAKKSNTQFISFSAIQMSEIYNQFNNIILLKPAPADAKGIRHMSHQVFAEEAQDNINQMYVANIENHNEQIDLDL